MEEYLIANTTKEQRIALIRSWVPDDEAMDENDIDIWEMYRDYIDGKKEIPECNAAFADRFEMDEREEWKVIRITEDDYGCEERAPGEKKKCFVYLEKKSGEKKTILVEDEYLDKKGIGEGSRWQDLEQL